MNNEPKYEDGTPVPPFVEEVENMAIVTSIFVAGLIIGFLIGDSYNGKHELPRDNQNCVHGRSAS